jgi:hypothetical protein
MSLELIELLDHLRVVHRRGEDQQRVVAVAHRAQSVGLRRARCAWLWAPRLSSHRSQAEARQQDENGRPKNQ